MTRRVLLGLTLAAFATPAAAGDAAPEKLLPPTTQLYVRWDGVTPHKAAYEASVWGPIMKGPTGDSIRTLLAAGPKRIGASLLSDTLLAGKSPDELRAIHADVKHLERLVALVADKGVVVAAEVQGPRPTLKALGGLLDGLLGGKGEGREELATPVVKVFLIVPDVGDRAETLFAPTRLYARTSGGRYTPEPLPAALKVKGYRWPSDASVPLHMAEWVIDGHFVEYVGTVPAEAVIEQMRADAVTGGLTAHPLFRRCGKTGDFESVARGFADTGALVDLAKRLAGPFVPGLAEKIDATGLGGLKAVVFSSGFRGKESRALYEFDLPGERKGLARVLKPAPLTVADLPPLPPDVSRFSMLRVDLPAAYDAALTAAEVLSRPDGGPDGKATPEAVRARKAEFERELTRAAGIDVREELLPCLGDRVCMFQSPAEGLSVFGTVVCVSLKDPAKARTAADRLTRFVESVGGPVKVRKKVVGGVEVRQVHGRDFGFLTPTYAVVGDWLVVSGYPQPVHGMALRHAGAIGRWKPDADTAARLAAMPADAVGLQYCDPRGTVQNLCMIGPLVLTALDNFGRRNGGAEFDPLDIGLIPNAHELSRHLFPNLTYTRDDGKTVRIEVNESFSLPLEFIGLEPAAFGIFTSFVR